MITAETLLDIPLLAAVPDHERASIAARAADVRLATGEWLIQEGEAPSFFALLTGRLAVSKRAGDVEVALNTYVPGSYFGEVPLLLNSTSVASLRALEPSRVMRLDAPDFRELIVSCERLREQIVRTMAARVGDLQRFSIETPVPKVTIVGHRYDLECHDVRDFFTRNHVPFIWRDPDDPATPSRLTLIFADGSQLVAPTYRVIADRLGLQTAPVAGKVYDVVIVGAGPAGLAAGVYGASEGLRTMLIEREAPGGQAGSSSRIENYLGFPAGVSGDDLSTRAWQQAKRFGAEMLSARVVVGLEAAEDGAHRVRLDGGEYVAARAIVIATGVSWRKLEAEGIERFTGRGVYYGAARTEALATRGKDVYLVGGGNSAGQAAMFFANYARSVSLVVRAQSLTKSMSQYLIDQLATKGNVRVVPDSEVVAVDGTEHVEAIILANRRTDAQQTFATNALFVLIGADAETDIFPREIVRDARGYLCTGRDVLDLETQVQRRWRLERDPYLLETSVPGIFAAGDVRHGSIKRVASAVGEGSMSIAFTHRYLEEVVSVAAP